MGINLEFTPQGKAVESFIRGNVTEHRLDRSQSLMINRLANEAVDFLFHRLGKGIGGMINLAMKEGNLPDGGTFGMSQTLASYGTRESVALCAAEFYRLVTVQVVMGAIAIE